MLVKIEITECFRKEITIEALSTDEAERQAIDMYDMGQVTLDDNDFVGAEIKVKGRVIINGQTAKVRYHRHAKEWQKISTNTHK